MLFWTVIKLSLKSLFANKLRSFLAMLGIIIGVGAVISMLALGSGAERQVMDRLSSLGTNLLIVRPGAHGSGGVISGTQQNLTLEDAESLIHAAAGIRHATPIVGGTAQLKYYEKNARVSVVGAATTYLAIRNFEVQLGRSFSESEADQMARVVVLGPVTAKNLFGNSNPLEQLIKINGINFRVVGILKSKGDQGWYNPDDQAILPYRVAMKQVFGVDRLREIDVEAAPGVSLAKLQDELTTLLRRRHHLQGGAVDDFTIQNEAEVLQLASTFGRMFTILLGGIASISLLVGGIGIMNIMLVTVTERTREIGIRKAIGARGRDILRQFLLESMVMSLVGGAVGVGLGVGFAVLVSALTPFETVIQISNVLIALFFAMGVGIFFGIYPARRAARLDPIISLRYE
jgi:putative ABC transport system permease protein